MEAKMWSYRRIMIIYWKEMKSNAEVLKRIGLKNTELVLGIKKKEIGLLWTCKKASSLTKISV